jgi:hypothetical protein
MAHEIVGAGARAGVGFRVPGPSAQDRALVLEQQFIEVHRRSPVDVNFR